MNGRERTGPCVTPMPSVVQGFADNDEHSQGLFQAGPVVVGSGRRQLPRSQETPDDLVGVDVLAGLAGLPLAARTRHEFSGSL